MAVIKIGDLTTFTGDTSGSWLVINDSNNIATYKAQREQLLSGSFFGTASYAVTASYALSSGGSNSTKFWLYNLTQSVSDDETIVISDNYVLKNSLLVLNGSAEEFSVQNINFTKKAQIFIGGHLLLVDSDIINDGIISIAGALILSGSSTITGTGIII